ncbi:hypothetical protein Dimus_012316 [Dionaea muscipula]
MAGRGRKGWPKGRPRKIEGRSAGVDQVLKTSKAAGEVSDLGDSCALIAREVDCVEAFGFLASGKSCGSFRGGERDSTMRIGCIEGQISSASRPSWADDCEKVNQAEGVVEGSGGLLQDSLPAANSGDFIRALTQGKDREKSPQGLTHRMSMEGNRAMCNGVKLWGHKDETCRSKRQQRKEWRPVKKNAEEVSSFGSGMVQEKGKVMQSALCPEQGEPLGLVGNAAVRPGRISDGWQMVKGSTGSSRLPSSSSGALISSSRFSLLVENDHEVADEPVVGDLMGGILIPGMDAVT